MLMQSGSVSRILFDKNVPGPLARFLVGHEVRTTDDEGWSELSNGTLLASAEGAGFDVLVTCDQNIPTQNNLAGRRIALVVLSTNAWPVIRDNLDPVIRAIDAAMPGSHHEVQFTRPALRRRPPPETSLG